MTLLPVATTVLRTLNLLLLVQVLQRQRAFSLSQEDHVCPLMMQERQQEVSSTPATNEPGVPGVPEVPPLPVPPAAPSGQRTVLVVEDDALTRQIYLYELRRNPALYVVEAIDGIVALFLLARMQPAAIIFDWHVPGLDGWLWLSAKEDVERRVGWAHAPVIVATADEMVLRRFAGASPPTQSDIVKVLRKPVSSAVLHKALQSALSAAAPRDSANVETPGPGGTRR